MGQAEGPAVSDGSRADLAAIPAEDSIGVVICQGNAAAVCQMKRKIKGFARVCPLAGYGLFHRQIAGRIRIRIGDDDCPRLVPFIVSHIAVHPDFLHLKGQFPVRRAVRALELLRLPTVIPLYDCLPASGFIQCYAPFLGQRLRLAGII